ncbi:MAG: hypothetical protein LBT84_01805 [Spirochaetia bacterium]|jgi:YbbR domain-containing protein|nr:hypothetical protein [Spirochaetia bacterium]
MRRFIDKFKALIRKKDLLPKIICLLLACVLWAYLSLVGKGGDEIQFRVALSFENLPAGMAVSNISNRFVTVLVQGKTEAIKSVHVNNIKAIVDLKKPQVGVSAQYPIQIIRSGIPDGVSVESRQYSAEIVVELQESKSIKVVPVMTGTVAAGFSIGPVRVKPDTVRVRGARSIVESLTKLDTGAISIDGAESDIVTDIVLNSEHIDSLELGVSRVQVTIPVAKEGAFINLSVPITIKNPPKGYDLSLSDTQTVLVYIKNSTGAALNAADVSDAIDSAEIDELMKNKKKAVLKLPVSAAVKNMEGIEIISVSPEEAGISVLVK